MSQSLETTTTSSDFDVLGYPDQDYGMGYYTAQARPGIGVCVANMTGGTMVQFFPWTNEKDASDTGHARYAAFITDKATAAKAEEGELFQRWPFLHADTNELLIIKCMVEEGLNEVEKANEELQRSPVDPAARQAVE